MTGARNSTSRCRRPGRCRPHLRDARRSRQSALVLVDDRQRSDDTLGSRGDLRGSQGAVSEELGRLEGVGEAHPLRVRHGSPCSERWRTAPQEDAAAARRAKSAGIASSEERGVNGQMFGCIKQLGGRARRLRVHDTDRAHPRHWPMQLAGRADRRNRDPLLLPPTRRPRTGLRGKTIARNSPRAVQGMPGLLASSSAGSRGKGIAANEEFPVTAVDFFLDKKSGSRVREERGEPAEPVGPTKDRRRDCHGSGS